MSTEKTKGASKGQEHYINSAKQPIEEKDINKRNQYAYWYELASKDVLINPIKDSVPADYIFNGVL